MDLKNRNNPLVQISAQNVDTGQKSHFYDKCKHAHNIINAYDKSATTNYSTTSVQCMEIFAPKTCHFQSCTFDFTRMPQSYTSFPNYKYIPMYDHKRHWGLKPYRTWPFDKISNKQVFTQYPTSPDPHFIPDHFFIWNYLPGYGVCYLKPI